METGNNPLKELTGNLKLVLYLDSTKFSYSIFNTDNNCFEIVEEKNLNYNNNINEEIQSIINANQHLNKKYPTTLLAIDLGPSTLIPEVLFEEKYIEKYIDLTSNKNQDNTCYYSKQQFTDCYSISSVNHELMDLLKNYFQKIKIKPFSSIFIDYAINLNKKTKELYVQINAYNFHMTLVNNKQLEFYNKFEFRNTNDFVYYFMNCINNLDFETEKNAINITSELNPDHILIETIKKYITIKFINRPTHFLYKDSIIKNRSYQNHNLFSQLICE
ncbi:MAG: hypothetical protein CMD26_02660 [Flavobacteriales bacterium]|nr:hypothetical protein [Flavobacteriales bacterium]|tara:strand:- start:11389 stop:12210 length:822 start_codon:yes stop_codon:yes gene_type:complete